jgi:hypothetical protein
MSTETPSVAVASTRVLYEVSAGGTLTMYLPNPIVPSWNVLQSRFGLSCSVTTTLSAGTSAVFSLENSIV